MRQTLQPLPPDGGVKFLYENPFGRIFLRLFSSRFLSKIAGKFLDSRLSKPLIKKFIKKHGIDMGEYLPETYKSFNAFFTRRIRPELRPFDPSPEAFCSPCDGAVTVFPITKEGTFRVKGFDYTAGSLLGDEKAAEKFFGGTAIVLRLTVRDYHRFCYPDGGTAGKSTFLKGRLHTVRPAALEKRRVFAENCREVTLLDTENFGCVAQTEVGAMFVGRIINENKAAFSRGEEKGRFEFGGSTIVLFLEAGKVLLDGEFFENTAAGLETLVRCGEKIGKKV